MGGDAVRIREHGRKKETSFVVREGFTFGLRSIEFEFFVVSSIEVDSLSKINVGGYVLGFLSF